MIPTPPKSRTAKRRRRITAWFGILVLALPMLIPVAQGIPLSNAAEGFKTPFYMVLCKAMQKGTGGTDHAPDDIPDLSDCPVCIGFAFGKSVLSTPQACDPKPQSSLLALVFGATDDVINGREVSSSLARAPPEKV